MSKTVFIASGSGTSSFHAHKSCRYLTLADSVVEKELRLIVDHYEACRVCVGSDDDKSGYDGSHLRSLKEAARE